MLSEVPLKQGSNIEAVCGRTIEKPQWAFEALVSGDLRSIEQITFGACGKCRKQLEAMDSEEVKKFPYLYGAVPKKEVKATDWAEAS